MSFEAIAGHMSRATALYTSQKYEACLAELDSARPLFAQLSSFLCHERLRTEAAHEAQTVRDAYEYACLCHARLGASAGFQLEFDGLRYYYADEVTAVIPASAKQPLLTGLYLLTLLIENRIGEFHAELELLPMDALTSMYIRPVIDIERYMMDGTFTKLAEARSTVPTNDYDVFFHKLIERVTQTIGEGIEASCAVIPQAAAKHLLAVGGDDATTSAVMQKLCASGTITPDGEMLHLDVTERAADKIPYQQIFRKTIACARGESTVA